MIYFRQGGQDNFGQGDSTEGRGGGRVVRGGKSGWAKWQGEERQGSQERVRRKTGMQARGAKWAGRAWRWKKREVGSVTVGYGRRGSYYTAVTVLKLK